MKSFVDKELCIGCENCENICPDVFEMKDDDRSHVKMNFIPAEHKSCALEAESECPVGAISHEE